MNANLTETHRFDDIINLPHHVSATHPRMSNLDRAAQFSAFAALSGFEAALFETARLTEERVELDENAMDVLDAKLRCLQDQIDLRHEICITYFIPDKFKTGGSYVTASGWVRQINSFSRVILMDDGTEIPVDEIVDIKGAFISFLE